MVNIPEESTPRAWGELSTNNKPTQLSVGRPLTAKTKPGPSPSPPAVTKQTHTPKNAPHRHQQQQQHNGLAGGGGTPDTSNVQYYIPNIEHSAYPHLSRRRFLRRNAGDEVPSFPSPSPQCRRSRVSVPGPGPIPAHGADERERLGQEPPGLVSGDPRPERLARQAQRHVGGGSSLDLGGAVACRAVRRSGI